MSLKTNIYISGVRGDQYPGLGEDNISGVRYNIRGERINIRDQYSGLEGNQYPGYEGIRGTRVNIRGTSGSISGVGRNQYPGYENINIRDTRATISGV